MAESRSNRGPDEGAPSMPGTDERLEGEPGPFFDRVRDRVTDELNSRKDRASDVLEDLAGTVRQVGQPLREGALAPLADYADQAASRIGEIAEEMRERDVTELADELRGLARRRPAAFAAAGFAAGLVAARFFKSTAERGASPPGPRARPMVGARAARRVK